MNETNQYLTFSLGEETYAIAVDHIREVLEVTRITKVPCMPPFFRGMINLRGSAIPILDLKSRFGCGDTEETATTAIVVLEIPTDSAGGLLNVGILTDNVNNVITLDRTSIERVPDFGLSVSTEFLEGIGKIDSQFVMLLNISRVFSDGELESIGQAAAAPVAEG
jgi:Chemotaxis signal transduction protein